MTKESKKDYDTLANKVMSGEIELTLEILDKMMRLAMEEQDGEKRMFLK